MRVKMGRLASSRGTTDERAPSTVNAS